MFDPGDLQSAAVGVEFETPENVRIRYPLAGPGTRFLAWLLDQLLVFVLTAVVSIGLLIAGIASGTLESALEGFRPEDFEHGGGPQTTMYFIGAMLLVMTFGSFVYYFFSELVLRGQTIGKRVLGVRVVKANGFSLDPLSLLIRNVFRFIDHLPPLWSVPVLSTRTQRPGDMAAGTLVVRERTPPLSPLRQELADRSPLESRYRFDSAMLARLRSVDIYFVEELLDRWDDLPRRQLQRLLNRALHPLCRRLSVEPPPTSDTYEFLEDLLAAEYRRRSHAIV